MAAEWVATLLKWLSDVLIGDKTITDNDLHISQTKDKKKIIVKNSGNGTINVQYNQISIPAEDSERVLKLLKEKAFDQNEIFIEDNAKKILTDIRDLEVNPDINDLVVFFTGKLPQNDVIIMRSGLYIRHLTELGDSSAQKMKKDIIARYGERGNHIINLASAGYFLSYIKPLYEQMCTEPEFSNEKFLQEYDIIVRDMPFAIFVNHRMNADEIVRKVEENATRQLRYDVSEEVIALHGYGLNTDTIAEAKKILDSRYSRIEENTYFRGIKISVVNVYYKTKIK